MGDRDLLWLHVIKECHFLGPSHTDFCDIKLKLVSPWKTEGILLPSLGR